MITGPGKRTFLQNPNLLIARLLRGGLIAAIVLLAAGAILAIAGDGTPVPREASLSDMPRALGHLEAGGFFTLGLFLLLLTPAARVVALLVVYLRDREWLFAGFSFLVLVLLALSGVLGLSVG